MNKFIAELIGTYCLVFAGTGAIIINGVSQGAITHMGIAMTFGLVVMAMIYAIGDLSGAHINPAVTIAFASARRFSLRLVAPYLISQCLGALLASITLRLLFPDQENLGVTLPAGSAMQSFTIEVILTAILMFVILSVSQGSKEIGLMAGIAVGGVVCFEAMFAGPITGASMNPARSLAPALVSGSLQHLWVYLAGPTLGALIAVPLWQFTRKNR